MEDIFKFLLLGGVIIISIVRSLKKAVASTEDQRPSAPKQPTVETAPDAVPILGTWGNIFSPKDIFQSETDMKESTSSSQKQKNQKKHIAQSGLGNNVVQQKTESQSNIPHTSSSPVSQELSDSEEDFTIHSAEEARRAIIWGEILQRKY